MPNGDPTPDCVHCKFYRGLPHHPEEESFSCTFHQIALPYPIYAFCSNYIDPQPDNKGDWLDQKVARNSLNPDMMYLWLSRTGGPEGEGVHFFYVPLVSITEYATWDRDKFLDTIQELAQQYYR